MINELKDIANRLCQYDSIDDGWAILEAHRHPDGTWNLAITPHKGRTSTAEPETEVPEEADNEDDE